MLLVGEVGAGLLVAGAVDPRYRTYYGQINIVKRTPSRHSMEQTCFPRAV